MANARKSPHTKVAALAAWLIWLGFVATGIAGTDYADHSKHFLESPSPDNRGRSIYASSCAQCHGADGKGNGPAGTALRVRPADLTLLCRHNHGRFPQAQVVSVLRFGVASDSEGAAEMPSWDTSPDSMNGKQGVADPQARAAWIATLTRYLRKIQAR